MPSDIRASFFFRHSSVLQLIAYLGIAAGVITGCVQRTISITSSPSAALVMLNDEEIGRTPVSVPYRFYGVYDVRIERDKQWLAKDEAATALNVSIDQLEKNILAHKIATSVIDGQEHVQVRYRPLWTKREAKAPWWEAPGPDLIAEAIPGGKIEQHWHFELQPSAEVEVDSLVERARALSQDLDQTE